MGSSLGCTQRRNSDSTLFSSTGGSLDESSDQHDVVVDWGGNSFKVFIGGTRVCTEVLDANSTLCNNGVLQWDKLETLINIIEKRVLALGRSKLPGNRRNTILIAQTGKARELALQDQTV